MNRLLGNNKLYYLLSSTLIIFTGLLNLSNKLFVCAFVYVLIALTANIVAEFYGKKKTIYAILAAILINSGLFWNSDYYINNVKVNIILLGSFLSVLVSVYCGINVSLKLKNVYNFHMRNLLSLIFGSIVDCMIMGCTLLSAFAVDKVAYTFSKDIAFKFSYSLSLSMFIILLTYLSPLASKLSLR